MDKFIHVAGNVAIGGAFLILLGIGVVLYTAKAEISDLRPYTNVALVLTLINIASVLHGAYVRNKTR